MAGQNFTKAHAGPPVGIGPVIAGWNDGHPCYFFEVAYLDGRTERRTIEKRRPGADRVAKLAAYHARMQIATALRESGALVLAHDKSSFQGLLSVIGRLAPRSAPQSAAT